MNERLPNRTTGDAAQEFLEVERLAEALPAAEKAKRLARREREIGGLLDDFKETRGDEGYAFFKRSDGFSLFVPFGDNGIRGAELEESSLELNYLHPERFKINSVYGLNIQFKKTFDVEVGEDLRALYLFDGEGKHKKIILVDPSDPRENVVPHWTEAALESKYVESEMTSLDFRIAGEVLGKMYEKALSVLAGN